MAGAGTLYEREAAANMYAQLQTATGGQGPDYGALISAVIGGNASPSSTAVAPTTRPESGKLTTVDTFAPVSTSAATSTISQAAAAPSTGSLKVPSSSVVLAPLRQGANALRANSVLSSANNSTDMLSAAKLGIDLFRMGSGAGLNGIDTLAGNLFPSLFGNGFTAADAGFLGQFGVTAAPQAAGALSGVSVSGIFSGAGIGYAINSINPLVKDKNTATSVISTAAGAIGGAVGGPIGAVAASFVASTLSGVLGIGPGRAHPASTFGGDIDENGKWNGVIQSKHLDTSYGAAFNTAALGYIQQLNALGVKFENTNIHGGVDDGRGLVGRDNYGNTSTNGQEYVWFDPNDINAADQAMARVYTRAADLNKIDNEGLRNALANFNYDGKGTQQVLTELKAAMSPTAPASGGTPATSTKQPDTTAPARIEAVTNARQAQFDNFIKAVEGGKSGKAATIKSSPRGDTSAATGSKRQLIGVTNVNDRKNLKKRLLEA